MKDWHVPAMLHELFGKRQHPAAVASVLLFGGLMTAALYAAYPGMSERLPIWRSLLALLLIFDVCAGCIANFTVSTSNFYASRPVNRIVFLAVHVHVVLIALLLDAYIWHAVGAWAYTIAGAFAVNALHGARPQLFVAALLLAGGIGWMPMLPDIAPYMLIVCLLFMLKVLFGFAVDHYGKAPVVGGEKVQR